MNIRMTGQDILINLSEGFQARCTFFFEGMGLFPRQNLTGVSPHPVLFHLSQLHCTQENPPWQTTSISKNNLLHLVGMPSQHSSECVRIDSIIHTLEVIAPSEHVYRSIQAPGFLQDVTTVQNLWESSAFSGIKTRFSLRKLNNILKYNVPLITAY